MRDQLTAEHGVTVYDRDNEWFVGGGFSRGGGGAEGSERPGGGRLADYSRQSNDDAPVDVEAVEALYNELGVRKGKSLQCTGGPVDREEAYGYLISDALTSKLVDAGGARDEEAASWCIDAAAPDAVPCSSPPSAPLALRKPSSARSIALPGFVEVVWRRVAFFLGRKNPKEIGRLVCAARLFARSRYSFGSRMLVCVTFGMDFSRVSRTTLHIVDAFIFVGSST